jgi:nitrite reductase/ring-hydroxylating ferredoxin subunit
MDAIDWVPVATTGELPLNEIREVLAGGGVIAVVRTSSGFYAFDNNCAHMGVALSRGQLEGDTVICRMHRWAYDLRTSTITQPPAGRSFVTFPTRVAGDTLLVRLPRTSTEAPHAS